METETGSQSLELLFPLGNPDMVAITHTGPELIGMGYEGFYVESEGRHRFFSSDIIRIARRDSTGEFYIAADGDQIYAYNIANADIIDLLQSEDLEPAINYNLQRKFLDSIDF